LHARMAQNWGLRALNGYEYKRSIKAMKMADDVIARVLLLEGLPNLQDLGKLLIGEDVPEIFNGDLYLLGQLRAQLCDGVAVCEQAHDFVSRALLAELLEETEEHIDWVESQQWLIENAGLQNYLQSQMEE
ncbi:MAG: bacterioferritin, partial [Acidihalobacter sp.]